MSGVSKAEGALGLAAAYLRQDTDNASKVSNTATALRTVLAEEKGWLAIAERVIDLPHEELERLCFATVRRVNHGDSPDSLASLVSSFKTALADIVARDVTTLARDFTIALDSGSATRHGLVAALRAVRDQHRVTSDSAVVRFSGANDGDIEALAAEIWHLSGAATSADPRAALIETVSDQPRSMWTRLMVTTPSANRLTWMAQGSTNADLADLSAAERTWAGSDFHAKRLDKYLFGGAHSSLGLTHVQRRASLQSDERAHYAARLRDLNNVLFTGVCAQLAEQIAALGVTEPPGAAHGPQLMTYDKLPTSAFVPKSLKAPYIADALSRPNGALMHVDRCVGLVPERGGHEFPGMFYVRLPIGDFGAELSAALAEAARLAMPLAAAVGQAATRHDDVVKAVMDTTVMRDIEQTTAEGIASTATSVALLLAHKPAPPYDDLDAALTLLDRANLVSHLSAIVPFGLLGPMATLGVVPRDALHVIRRKDGLDHAVLPSSFEQLMEQGQAEIGQALSEGKRHLGFPQDPKVITQRGCPVAGRGPLRGIDGTIELSSEAGLSLLTHAMIQLTRKVLSDRQARSADLPEYRS
jgi:hypothetical protein